MLPSQSSLLVRAFPRCCGRWNESVHAVNQRVAFKYLHSYRPLQVRCTRVASVAGHQGSDSAFREKFHGVNGSVANWKSKNSVHSGAELHLPTTIQISTHHRWQRYQQVVSLSGRAGPDTNVSSAQQASDGGNKNQHDDEHLDEKESKVEKTVKQLREQKEAERANLNYSTLVDEAEKPKSWMQKAVTRTYWSALWIDIKDWLQHMKDGFKLLWVDTKIASKMLYYLLQGGSLTRRERKQFVRTVSDLFRLVPFSVFIIVPFGELALPFAVKLFPNLLPSTFQDKKSVEDTRRANMKMKIDMAQFLQEAVEEMAVTRKKFHSEQQQEEMSDFLNLLDKGRASAVMLPTDELLKYSRLCDNVLTLDSLTHSQLKAICKLLLLPTYGTNNFLSFQIRYRLKTLKADDVLIRKEGVDTLTVSELQELCRERGMRALGVSEEGLRQRLQQWLHLHLDERVPASLLMLSRISYLPENVNTSTQLATAIENLPDSVKAEVRIAAVEQAAGRVSAQEKISVITKEQEIIDRERTENTKKRQLDLERKKEQEEKDKESMNYDRASKAKVDKKDTKSTSSFDDEAKQPDLQKIAGDFLDQQWAKEEALTVQEMRNLAEVLEQATADGAEAALHKIREAIAAHDEDLLALTVEGAGNLRVPRGSTNLSQLVAKMLHAVEADITRDVDEHPPAGAFKLDLNNDGMVSTEELVSALKLLDPHNNKPGKLKSLRKLVRIIDADHDGIVHLDALVKIIQAMRREAPADVGEGKEIDVIAAIVKAAQAEEHAKEALEAAKEVLIRQADPENALEQNTADVGASPNADEADVNARKGSP
eukprot:m.788063 g.788063  ORF g.788063 m.788063 type:complete len:823 (-) comp23312_c0_seq2:324-2792(-)